MKYTTKYALFAAASSLLAALPAMAFTNANYNAGDLMLYFQEVGAGASTKAVYVDLGSAATVFRGSSTTTPVAGMYNITNIDSTMTSAFGAGWATNTEIYVGTVGVYSNSTFNTVTNGDPARTLYVSDPRTALGTVGSANSTAWFFGGNTAMTSAATSIQTMDNDFGNNYQGQQVVASNSAIAFANPFTQVGANYYQGNGFNSNFAGGVEQQGSATGFANGAALGGVSNLAYALDLNRIIPSTGLAGEVAGTLRTGDYLGTIAVGSNGSVNFITAVPEPSSMVLAGLAAGTLLFRRRRSA
jgi:hypothetical protein